MAGGPANAYTRKAAVPQLPELPAERLALPAENGTQQSALTAAQAQALLDDPRMILVNRTHRITEDYPVETKECGSATAINKTLQTEAADAFLAMQAAAAKDGVSLAGEARDMETGKDALAGDAPAKSTKSRTGQDIAQ